MRRRLDVEMTRRGLSATRSEAADAVQAGRVLVAGRPATKAGMLVGPADAIALSAPARRFVSRGGEKLEGALDAFALDVTGRLALDAGVSTGGFTDCLLTRGAAHVVAVDVGYGQLAWSLRRDPRVTVMERTNVRHVHAADLPYRPDLVTADLSFISLRLVLTSLAACAAAEADFVLLVKPQFEVGASEIGRGGVVAEREARRAAVESVARACFEQELGVVGIAASSPPGPAGNAEFFILARRPVGPEDLVGEALGAAVEAALDRADREARSG